MLNSRNFLRKASSIVCFAAAAFLTTPAGANVGEAFGFGSRSAAMGGAALASSTDAFATYANPAALATNSEKKLQVSFGLLYMQPNLTQIKNVVTENLYNSDRVTVSDVANDYRATFGQELGLSYRLLPEMHGLTIGITTFLPLDSLAYMDTGESYVPEYVLYRSRTQRPQIELASGISFPNGIHLGFGAHFAFSLTSNATVFLKSNLAQPSTMRFSASMQPKLAPYFGFLYTPPNDLKAAAYGAVIRLPVTSNNKMILKTGAQLFSTLPALDFNFNALSALYYDPWSFEVGYAVTTFETGKTVLQIDYQLWSLYQAPSLLIQDPSITSCNDSSCGVAIAGGKNPAFEFRNIIVPRIGQEFVTKSGTAIRFGYAFRPSFIQGLPTGIGNYLDPAKHMVTAGIGIPFTHLMSVEAPVTLDFHFSYQQLVSQHIDKTPGDEAGDLTKQKIGAPGYDAGGNVVGGGVSLSVGF